MADFSAITAALKHALDIAEGIGDVADGDLVDAEIVGYEAQCATYERRVKSALAVLEDEDLSMWRRHAIALEYLRSAL